MSQRTMASERAGLADVSDCDSDATEQASKGTTGHCRRRGVRPPSKHSEHGTQNGCGRAIVQPLRPGRGSRNSTSARLPAQRQRACTPPCKVTICTKIAGPAAPRPRWRRRAQKGSAHPHYMRRFLGDSARRHSPGNPLRKTPIHGLAKEGTPVAMRALASRRAGVLARVYQTGVRGRGCHRTHRHRALQT